jgi:hypothetical protein
MLAYQIGLLVRYGPMLTPFVCEDKVLRRGGANDMAAGPCAADCGGGDGDGDGGDCGVVVAG